MWQDRAKDILSTLKVELSEGQSEVFYGDGKIKIIGGGEGSSKSFLGALSGLCRAIDHQYTTGFANPYLIWVVGGDYEDARKECEYLVGPDCDWLADLGILNVEKTVLSSHKDQKVIIHTNIGVTIETVSGYDPLKIGRDQPDGIIGCEVSRWDVEVWNRCYGRLARRYAHSWGWFSGSFETSLGWFPEAWAIGQHENDQDLVSYRMPTWFNEAIYPGGYNDIAIQKLRAQTSEVRFQERFGGQPAPPQDSVLPEFRVIQHVTADATYDSDYPVFLAADPGTHVYAVLFIQVKGAEIHVVDEVYAHNLTHDQVISACQFKPAWAGVQPEGLHVMDVAGGQRHMGMQSSIDAWYDATGLSFFSQYRSIDDEIEKLRSVLERDSLTDRPYLHINSQCPGIISEMGGGASPVINGGRWIMKNGKPVKANNHACQALAYWLLAQFGAKKPFGMNFTGLRENRGAASYLTTRARSEGVLSGLGSYVKSR